MRVRSAGELPSPWPAACAICTIGTIAPITVCVNEFLVRLVQSALDAVMVSEPRDVRLPLMVTRSEADAIDAWRYENKVPTRAEAIRRLIEIGLETTKRSGGSMKKADCEKAIRHLCRVWATERGVQIESGGHPSFLDFKAWLKDKGHGDCLNFRSVAGPDHDAEMWFDRELGQAWRN